MGGAQHDVCEMESGIYDITSLGCRKKWKAQWSTFRSPGFQPGCLPDAELLTRMAPSWATVRASDSQGEVRQLISLVFPMSKWPCICCLGDHRSLQLQTWGGGGWGKEPGVGRELKVNTDLIIDPGRIFIPLHPSLPPSPDSLHLFLIWEEWPVYPCRHGMIIFQEGVSASQTSLNGTPVWSVQGPSPLSIVPGALLSPHHQCSFLGWATCFFQWACSHFLTNMSYLFFPQISAFFPWNRIFI